MKTMKMKLVVLSVLFAFTGAAQSSSADSSLVISSNTVQQIVLQDLQATALDLINWKIGDTTSYDIEMGAFGKLGTMTKTATKNEDKAVWIKNDADLGGQKDVTEILISRTDGKILKMIHNGQEQSVPDDKIEIISQEYTEITVPAGKFKCVHIVAKSKQTEKMEIWANPQAVALDGGIQMIVATQMGEMTLKLTSFKKNN